VATKVDLARFNATIAAMRTRLQSAIRGGASREAVVQIIEKDYGWRATGCPPAPQMTPGCLQYQQIDALIEELR
jgi:cytochrome c-type biogenesis protein CcmH/NrfF